MFGREDLDILKWNDNLQYILAEEANAVMDKMEARIKELEAENEKLEDDWQKSYAEECVTRHKNHRLVDRIKELEDIIKIDDAIRITSLENENEHLKERNSELSSAIYTDNSKVIDTLQSRVNELESLCTKYQAELMNSDNALNESRPCKHCVSIPGQEALVKDEYNTLYLDNDILRFSSREGEDDYVLETRINFCPICGMELEHEN